MHPSDSNSIIFRSLVLQYTWSMASWFLIHYNKLRLAIL